MKGICQVLLLMLIKSCFCRTKEEWKSRIIYQLLTDRFASDKEDPPPCNDLRSYCGGNFRGIIKQLDYLAEFGINAIWISPIAMNTPGGYHGYWAKDIYSINPHFGTEDDLKHLISECHKLDIWVMVDVVPNHMGYTAGCSWNIDCDKAHLTNFSGLYPFNQTEHYHSLCEINDFDNQTEVELCRLAKLPDLNQTNKYVRSTLLSWVKDMTVKFNIDGYRIDTVVEVDKVFWTEFQEAAGVFCLGEANNGDNVTYLAGYQGPLDSVLNFPLFHVITRVFANGHNMSELALAWLQQSVDFKDETVLGNFVDNHDVRRFLNIAPELSLLKNALAYILMGEGIPVIYYGTEQGFSGGNDPENREVLWPNYHIKTPIYQFISSLAWTRRITHTDLASGYLTPIHLEQHFYVFSRGDFKFPHEILVFLTNKVNDLNETKTFTVEGFENREYENIEDDEDIFKVKNGKITVTFTVGMPKIYRMTTGIQVIQSVNYGEKSTTISFIVTFLIIFLHYFL